MSPYRLTVALICVSLIWAGLCINTSLERWKSWDIGIDTALWTQIANNGSSGKTWSTTVFSDTTPPQSIFAYHYYLYLFPMDLLFRLVPHPLIFYFIQHMAYAFGALFVGLIAFRLSEGDYLAALLMAVLFLVYAPHARSQTAYDFSPRHFSLFFLPLCYFAAVHERFGLSIFPLIALAAGEENLGLLAGFTCFGLAWNYPGKRRFYLASGTLFCLYSVSVLFYGLSLFSNGDFPLPYTLRYSHLKGGVENWIFALFTHENLAYVMLLTAPLAFLPLFGCSLWFFSSLPFLFQNTLNAGFDTRMIGHHYTTPLAVTCFLAFLEITFQLPKKWIRGLLVFLVFLNVFLGMTYIPGLAYMVHGVDDRSVILGKNLDPVIQIIPEGASISAPPAICTRFWKSGELFFLPWGTGKADWVVLPKFSQGYPVLNQEEILELYNKLKLDKSFSLLFENPAVFIFKRNTENYTDSQPLK